MYNTPRAATVITNNQCKLWFIDRAHFRTIVTFYQLARTAKYVNFLAEVKFGERKLAEVLSQQQLEKIAGALEVEVFQTGEYIIRQGQDGDYFYIVEEGEVGIYKTYSNDELEALGNSVVTSKQKAKPTPLVVLKAGSYFGEKALLAEEKRQASCIAETPVKCLTLGRDDFVMMLGNLEDLMTKGKAVDEEVKDSSEPQPTILATEEFSFKSLKVIRVLGSGAFGRVKLVQSKVDGRTFALKCQSKKGIVENELQVRNNLFQQFAPNQNI